MHHNETGEMDIAIKEISDNVAYERYFLDGDSPKAWQSFAYVRRDSFEQPAESMSPPASDFERIYHIQ